MENKEKIIEELKGLYFERRLPPGKPKPKEPLDQLLALNDINVFFKLWESNNVILRAWAWKGIMHFIEGLKDSKQIERVQQIAIELLKDNREITVYSGDVMRHPKLCMLHIRDFRHKYSYDHSQKQILTHRSKPIILKPVLEFLKSEETQTNEAVADLLFDFYSEISDSEIEPLILRHAKNAGKSDFKTKFEITKVIKCHFEKTGEFKNKEELIKIFNDYLKDIEQDVTEAQETHKSKKFSISRYKQNLHSNIIALAEQMDLNFEKETFDSELNR